MGENENQVPPSLGRREALYVLGLGVVSAAAAPLLGACSSDDGGSAASTTTTPSTTTTTAPPVAAALGELGPPDANGLRLPEGFSSRIVAKGGETVPGTDYQWHQLADGGACFAAGDGWIYVSNSELPDQAGGVSMLRFDADGEVVEARPICRGTNRNCAGGVTPWGTWLTCEEVPDGQVWECDPTGERDAVVRPAMGRFNHEAVAVDPGRKVLYLTEDMADSGLYRFTPATWEDLSDGDLEVLAGADGSYRWERLDDPSGASIPTRNQVTDTVRFNGGEGIGFHDGTVFFTTKGDNRVWALRDGDAIALEVVYDAATHETPILTGVDNLTIDAAGARYVAEDHGDVQIVRLTDDGEVVPVLQVVVDGAAEVAGPAFTPDGTRLYFSLQIPTITYEVTGPFHAAGSGS